MKILPWSKDSFLSRNGKIIAWDKLEHLIREFTIMMINFLFFKVGLLTWILVTQAFGLIWEVKDGFLPYGNNETNPDRLIEGFSFKDLIANQVGILIAVIFGKL